MPLADVMDLLDLIPEESLKGFDVVEFCPPYDHAEITAFTAAKIVRKLILIQAGSKQFFYIQVVQPFRLSRYFLY
jgi:arginase family enzyme